MADATLPCIELPKPQVITIPLPFGAEIKSVIDISKPPSDCAVVHSLMLQLQPLLAAMACLLKVLQVLGALKKVADKVSIPPDIPGIANTVISDLVPALAGLADCFLIFDPCKIAKMISAILGLILSYLDCLLQAIESLLNFQLGIDLDAAQGNPVLLASLDCAQKNAESSMLTLSQAMEVIQPILDLVSPLLELAGIPPIELPPTNFSTGSLADQLAAGEDPLKPLKDVIAVLSDAKATVDAICP
jgi:hypothetical protein